MHFPDPYQNFLTVNGLLFSILAGNSFIFLYTQTEAIYYALFAEVRHGCASPYVRLYNVTCAWGCALAFFLTTLIRCSR